MKLITDKLTNGLTNPKFVEYLKTPVIKSEFTVDELDSLRKTLSDALVEYGGLGIAATQLGIKKRVCLINVDDEELFLVNPIIKSKSDEGFVFFEGCLSIPKTMSKPIETVRATKIVVQTDNLGDLTFQTKISKDKEEITKETLTTVVVQHEIDHLDGITIKDRVYSTTIKKKTSYGRNDKIVMKSPKGELVEVKYKKANDYYLQGYEIV